MEASGKIRSAGSLVTALLVLTLATPALATSNRQRRIASTATSAFRGLLHHRYGAFRGFWTCPVGQFFGSQIFCEAEFRQGDVWTRVAATARVNTKPISFSHVGDVSWTRQWSPYTHRVIAGFGATGVASVNTVYEDWSFISGGVYYQWKQHHRYATIDGYDGPGLGLERFTSFRCRLRARPITCTNSFGDSIRYRPRG